MPPRLVNPVEKSSCMFCPKCGNADQTPETYCRQCGVFLPDLSKPVKREQPAEEHLKVNTVLSLMTVIVSFTLAILLYAFFGFRNGTHPMIYVTSGLLIAMGAWHIQTFIRTRQLKRQWKRRTPATPADTKKGRGRKRFKGASTTAKLLDVPDFSDSIPASVTDHTTRHLSETKTRSS